MDAGTMKVGAEITVQLVGLLAAWKQERKSTENDHFQSFIVWLQTHHFDAIKERIFESDELQRELHSLLEGELETISQRLDTLNTSVARLISKVEEFAPIERIAARNSGSLSSQAGEILKLFAKTKEAQSMGIFAWGPRGEKSIVFIPEGGSYTMDDARFLDDDIESLSSAELIQLTDYNSNGWPIYALTRKGHSFAQSLPPVEVNSA